MKYLRSNYVDAICLFDVTCDDNWCLKDMDDWENAG